MVTNGTKPSADTFWAAFWGILYRKFFWDFVGGIVRAPGGIQYVPLLVKLIQRYLTIAFRPANNVAFFIDIIVKAPVVQILSAILAFTIIALEYPAPFLKGTSLHRSLAIRVVLLFAQAFLSILYYQVCGAVLVA